MNQYVKRVIRYGEDNICRYYLSPYAEISQLAEGIKFKQWLFGKTLFLQCSPKKTICFIDKLRNGLSAEEMEIQASNLFGKESRDILVYLMKNGIIE